MADTEKSATTGPESSTSNEPEKMASGAQQQQATTQQPPDAGKQGDAEKKTEDKKADDKDKDDKKKSDEPAGGFDSTQFKKMPPGWTLKFTFIRAANLPMADINTLSSDPYVAAQLTTSLPPRHKEDPPLRFRTQTIRRNTEPTWSSEWIVANIPSSGFKLKARLYDEDPADHDDRLGNAHINVDRIDENWPGIKNQAYSIKKRMGSKRAYLVRAVTTCLGVTKHMNAQLYISVELLGRTKDENGGRAYTIGPSWWVKHYSPMLGRITGLKEEDDNEEMTSQKSNTNGAQQNGVTRQDTASSKRRGSAQRYNFQANQMQLPGPVPAELYHRYVEFKPFVQGMFTHKGIRGFLLNKALHHQHARVYNYDGSTLWGIAPADDPEALSRRFLELVHYDRGGKIFTYVLTLDGQFRFTETGKEFGIDMLSKHSMHSNVEIYIAFSGEFFIRRHKPRKGSNASPDGRHSRNKSSTSADHRIDQSKPAAGEEMQKSLQRKETLKQRDGEVDSTTPVAAETRELDEEALDPDHYEIIIDNDSGTYRPAAHLLPLLRLFLQRSFPGLHVRVLDCQKDEEFMDKLKGEQRDRKKAEAGGKNITYSQRGRAGSLSSVSSSDEEEAAQGHKERGLGKQLVRDAQWRAGDRVRHFQHNINPKAKRGEATGGQVEEERHETKKADQAAQQTEPTEAKEQQATSSENGPEGQTNAERIARERGHEYDADEQDADEERGEGQPIGRSENQEVMAKAEGKAGPGHKSDADNASLD